MFARGEGVPGLLGAPLMACRLFFAVLLVFLPPYIYSQAPQAESLLLNKPINQEIAGGQTQSYRVDLHANQYAKVLLKQHGIDVAVRLLGEDGKPAIEFDADPRNEGEETIEFALKSAGSSNLVVVPRLRTAPIGRYEISLVEVRPASEKDLALDEARRLSTEVNRLYFASDPDTALPLAEKALSIREKELGSGSAEYGLSLFLLGNVYSDKGDFNRAESLYKRAIEIREKALGKDHISMSLIYNNLGILYKSHGDYVKAEQSYKQALEIREKVLDPNHPLIAGIFTNLATVSSARGDNAKAREYYERALAIRIKSSGPESPEVATILNNLANLYSDPATTEQYYQRALAIREKVYGPDNPDVAQTLYNLAVLYSSKRDYARALPLCQRSLAIFEKSLGEEHPYVSYTLNLLAVIYKNLGDYAKSESLYERAIAIKEKTQPFHPDLGGTYANLANLRALKGEIDKAVDYQKRANQLLEYNIALNLSIGSEKEKLAYLSTSENIENQTLTLNFKVAPDSQAAGELGATTVLQRKGRVLDSISDSLAALRRRSSKDDQALLDDLNDTTTKLVGLVLDGPGDVAADEYKRKVKDLENRRADLESKISEKGAGFYERTKPVSLKDVQSVIPADAALIEFAVYRPISPKDFEFSDERADDPAAIGRPHYAVYVIRAGSEVKWKDLGETKSIDDRVDALREALRDPSRKDVNQIARSVDELIMRPIRVMAGDAAHLLISPDGELNLVPFEALVDENNHFLIERYAFTYLTSGRDLLRMQKPHDSKEPPLLIADPAFGPPETDSTKPNNQRRSASIGGRRASAVATRDLTDTFFAPLSGTAEEAQKIRSFYPNAKLLTGSAASESALKAANAPLILHLATHGFFLEDQSSFATRLGRPAKVPDIENPLLRSGLALAGANRHKAQGDDGILTALEASGLNLWGTKLVVLSACDTGVGEIRTGEGVYGLRRSFVLTGAESLVMSLWPVSDYITRDLMVGYYKNLKAGLGRSSALRQTQLDMLKRTGRSHPFYWASFIQSGEWANLDGKR
jgi:CHAT domain-containing protein/Tfp pilus assembly protein PilF